MSLCLINGRPVIDCGRCFHRITVTETLVLKWSDLDHVSFVCEPCADKLREQWPDKPFETVPALRYFQMLTGGRAVQARPVPVASASRSKLAPPQFDPKDVR